MYLKHLMEKKHYRAFTAIAPDMVILDVMMPVMDGFTCLKEIRKKSDFPVLMLTAKGEDYDQVEGLQKVQMIIS